jgi:N,N'-diacetyllegionaminate synthase
MNSRVKVVAEIGVNHNGSLSLAKELIVSAKESGADGVKFQTYRTEAGISLFAPKADYQLERTSTTESQFDMLKRLELSRSSHEQLISFAKEIGITFLSTACDLPSVGLLQELGVSPIKVASCDIVNFPLLRAISKLETDVYLSTGMATEVEVDQAIKELTGAKSLVLFLCTSEYPCPNAEVNLEKLLKLATWGLPLGFSDHTRGLSASVASIPYGVRIIERHFTLDKKMAGPDHAASLEPQELRLLTQMAQEAQDAIGSSELTPTESEIKNRELMRRKIVALTKIEEGDLITKEKIGIKRAANGIYGNEIDKVVGTIAQKQYGVDEIIE